MATRRRPPEIDYRDEPAAWFVLLDIARRTGHRADEAFARQQLRRLGYRVECAPRGPEEASR